jgi:type VI protein secretion system component VasK
MSKLETIACENSSESLTSAVLLSPFRTLFGKSSDQTLWAYCWLFLLVLYVIIYFALPNTFLNTYQGFKSGWVTLLWTLGIFFILVATYILYFRKSACMSKLERKNKKIEVPSWLQAAIDREKK